MEFSSNIDPRGTMLAQLLFRRGGGNACSHVVSRWRECNTCLTELVYGAADIDCALLFIMLTDVSHRTTTLLV